MKNIKPGVSSLLGKTRTSRITSVQYVDKNQYCILQYYQQLSELRLDLGDNHRT